MSLPITVTFQDMPPSPALRTHIEQHAERLERFAPDLLSCQVTVRHSEERHRKGNRYLVHVRLTLPGGEFEAGRAPDPDHSLEDPYVAVREAFDTLRRQLEDFVRIRRGDVKHHSPKGTPP